MSDQKEAAAKPYHHGNLRDTLIIAAANLIEEDASVDFAMIDAARRAGVSSAAPYRHFKDKDALLEAVSQLAFIGLSEATESTATTYPMGSENGIIALGKAYIAYVIQHRAFYDLMWGDMKLRGFKVAHAESKTSGFYVLVESVERWCNAKNLSEYDALDLAVKLWAMAHGLACLSMNQRLDSVLQDVDVYQLLESSTRTFLEGLQR